MPLRAVRHGRYQPLYANRGEHVASFENAAIWHGLLYQSRGVACKGHDLASRGERANCLVGLTVPAENVVTMEQLLTTAAPRSTPGTFPRLSHRYTPTPSGRTAWKAGTDTTRQGA